MPKYIAGLCGMGPNGILPPYETEDIEAADRDRAIGKARVWAVASGRVFVDDTFLLVMLNGVSIHSEKVEASFAPRP